MCSFGRTKVFDQVLRAPPPMFLLFSSIDAEKPRLLQRLALRSRRWSSPKRIFLLHRSDYDHFFAPNFAHLSFLLTQAARLSPRFQTSINELEGVHSISPQTKLIEYPVPLESPAKGWVNFLVLHFNSCFWVYWYQKFFRMAGSSEKSLDGAKSNLDL